MTTVMKSHIKELSSITTDNYIICIS